ncbi:MAG: mannose-1-phosphate guanylyltransferase/mannose-6-phosphate isomerase [Rhabdochlamydiaceae bacterium]|nr:mannose-1-phosphate guanylyltransferase/mannose-6-phosphate isomerase [Rhabdochlamydiaceae bacterium]
MKIVILAGGSGTRLWPLSRDSFPKQFLKIDGEWSLLQKTILRFYKKEALSDILILTNPECLHLVKSQAKAIHPLLEERVIIEPVRKNTGPAIVYAVKYLTEVEGVDLDETILVTPSDQIIEPQEKFEALISGVEELARKNVLVVFGIVPTKPETGYGYLQTSFDAETGIHKVLQFVEKPSLVVAEKYLSEGGYLWNSGMFAFTASTFFQEIAANAPELNEAALLSYQELQEKFSTLNPISIDYGLMEQTSNIVVIPLSLTWSDLGSWDSVFDALEKDSNQNVKVGNVHDIDTKNSLIYGGKRLISTIGLEDVIIVETDDALFLGKKGESQKVKELVEELKKIKTKEIQEHSTMQRPWGQYSVLETGPRFKVKRIIVNPGQKLSLQKHYHRSEHWVVVTGTARVTVGDEEKLLHENESIYISKSTIHRLENPGKVPLEMIEVQVGEYTGEDDIVRFEDVYGRVK